MENSKKNKKEFYKNLTAEELKVFAEQGDSEAQFRLGYRYKTGKGIKQNYKVRSYRPRRVSFRSG